MVNRNKNIMSKKIKEFAEITDWAGNLLGAYEVKNSKLMQQVDIVEKLNEIIKTLNLLSKALKK